MFPAIRFLTYLFLSLAGFVAIVNAGPTSSLVNRDSINPHGIALRSLDTLNRRSFEPRTNAERLRRGLAPLPPKRRTNGGSRRFFGDPLLNFQSQVPVSKPANRRLLRLARP